MPEVRILAVDDDRGTCAFVSTVLSNRGYAVDVAADGPEALRMANQHNYQLALLDYRLPGMNGVELFRRISEIQPEVVGVLITAYARIDTVYPAVAAGVVRVLPKPVSSAELLPLVEQLVGKPDRGSR